MQVSDQLLAMMAFYFKVFENNHIAVHTSFAEIGTNKLTTNIKF